METNNLQPTYRRQRFLLAFVRQLQDGVTSTELQKLVFLYTMKENSDFYEFIPYKFGSYSFRLAVDVDILRRDGFLSIDDSQDDSYIRAADDCLYTELYPIANERGNSLIRKAYREYPYYAVNSEITSHLFGSEEADRFKCEKEKYTQISQTLFTIGYEGKSVEAFINALIQNDIRVLCDVRKNPLSRKFGFSKNKLKQIMETVGIKYVHIPDLGIESDKRSSLETVKDYQRLFEGYEKTLPNYKQQLDQLYSLLCSNNRMALMCYEREPEMCHRHVLRNYLTATHEIRGVDL
jgi:uncharacterized protein (DUF488 family)